jgi:hypothetical protein
VILYGSTAPVGLGLLIVEVPRSILVRNTTLGRTPLDEGSAPSRDHYLTTYNTHKRQTSMPPAGFKPRSHQASGRTSIPWTTLPLGSASYIFTLIHCLYSRYERNVSIALPLLSATYRNHARIAAFRSATLERH